MLYAGLDLSRQRLDVHVLDEEGRTVEVLAVHPDADGCSAPSPCAAALQALVQMGTLWWRPLLVENNRKGGP
jgi:hypothetical protein